MVHKRDKQSKSATSKSKLTQLKVCNHFSVKGNSNSGKPEVILALAVEIPTSGGKISFCFKELRGDFS